MSLHCSRFDRSWVDLVTNLSLIAGVDVLTQFGSLIQAGKFPHSSLPSFLHELVHHWCFQSPVGSTLALLQLRARRRAIVIANDSALANSPDDLDIVEDLCRYEVAVNLLRPLAEGLALFAEFDVVPQRDSKFMTVPLQWIYLEYTRPSKEELKEDFGRSLFDLIWNMRTSPLYEKRKASFLLEPLDCQHGGYLAGYLMVKALWRDAVRRSELFLDTELFLAYLRSFVYDDFGLVEQLLEPSTAEVEAMNNISTYIQTRFDQFLGADLSNDGERFAEEISLLSAGVDREHGIVLSTEKVRVDAGKLLFEELLEELEGGDGSDFQDVAKRADLWTLAQRELMCVGSSAAQLRMPKPGCMVIETAHGPILAAACLPLVPVEEGECSIELYISPAGFYKAGLLSQKQRILWFHLNGLVTLSPEHEQQFRSYVVDRDRNQKMYEATSTFLETFVKERIATSVLLEHARSYTAEAPTIIYRSWLSLLKFIPDTVAKAMLQDGFSSLLDNDPEAVRALARLSLCCSLTTDRSAVGRMMSQAGFNLEVTLKNVERVAVQHNVVLADAFRDQVFTFI